MEVERKSENGYGNTNIGERKKVRFTSDFLLNLKHGNTYLTTQKIEETDQGEPKFFAPALVRKLIDAGTIPGFLPIAGNLVLDQINIWMGFSDTPTSSGFHHDFHDNFYFVIRGEKTFKLASPDKLGTAVTTYGSQEGRDTVVYGNGLVSYSGKDFREDGAPVESSLLAGKKNEEHPAHFCIEREAPEWSVRVDLKPGDIFYLPAGFFHEVLSVNDKCNNGHLVFNYWFHPPVSKGTFEQPYIDDFWADYAEKIERGGEVKTQKLKRPVYKPRPLWKYYSRKDIQKFLLKQAIRREFFYCVVHISAT